MFNVIFLGDTSKDVFLSLLLGKKIQTRFNEIHNIYVEKNTAILVINNLEKDNIVDYICSKVPIFVFEDNDLFKLVEQKANSCYFNPSIKDFTSICNIPASSFESISESTSKYYIYNLQ